MLRWFEQDPGDKLIGEIELIGVSLSDLQKTFQVNSSNPMYDCWKVEEAHLAFLVRHTNVEINLFKFDYFVEADAV